MEFFSVIKCNCGSDSYLLVIALQLGCISSSLAFNKISVCVSFIGESNSQITPISSFVSSSVSQCTTVTPIEESQYSY